MKKILAVAAIVFLLMMAFGCGENTAVKDGYVMQIKNVGIRKGVFERRYKLTSDYRSKNKFDANTLKNFIDEQLKPEYLLIQHAIDLGLDKDPSFQQKMNDFRVKLLAGNHPGQTENSIILKEDLQNLYARKKRSFDVELVQTNSYASADSFYRYLNAGGKLPQVREEQAMNQYPRFFIVKEVTIGEKLHPELFPVLEKMKKNETSSPVYTSPSWTVMRVLSEKANKNLPPFENYENTLLMQAEGLKKYRDQKELIETLKKNYQPKVEQDYYSQLKSAFTVMEPGGYIALTKIPPELWDKNFLTVGNESITIRHFVSNFNQGNQVLALAELTDQDLEMFVQDVIVQYLLYLDAANKGVADDPMIQDQLENKLHRMVYTQYLKEEIAQKVEVDDVMAERYYLEDKDKWQGSFEQVKLNVKSELKNRLMEERRERIVKKLDRSYKLRFNDVLLDSLAQNFARP